MQGLRLSEIFLLILFLTVVCTCSAFLSGSVIFAFHEAFFLMISVLESIYICIIVPLSKVGAALVVQNIIVEVFQSVGFLHP